MLLTGLDLTRERLWAVGGAEKLLVRRSALTQLWDSRQLHSLSLKFVPIKCISCCYFSGAGSRGDLCELLCTVQCDKL